MYAAVAISVAQKTPAIAKSKLNEIAEQTARSVRIICAASDLIKHEIQLIENAASYRVRNKGIPSS